MLLEREELMPEKATLKRARKDKAQGKAKTTQAGEFIREEIHHIREGKHGARSTRQAIAIGLSKARRAGVDLPPPKTGSPKTKASAARDYAKGHGPGRSRKPSRTRSRATERALQREGHAAASSRAPRHARARWPAGADRRTALPPRRRRPEPAARAARASCSSWGCRRRPCRSPGRCWGRTRSRRRRSC